MIQPGETGSPAPSGQATFATTHWSVVLAAGHSTDTQASAALEELCRTYWYPLYAHMRRRGYSIEEAQDLTQEFFARLLAKHWISRADAHRGRFRSFLLGACDHFLANEWDRARCEKRGGGQAHLPFDTVAAERLYTLESGQGLNAEELYERNWALRLLEQVRDRLREEYTQAGQAERFALSERFLPGEESPPSYAAAAGHVGVPEGTLKSDVHRLKQRYGQLLREEIAQTVARPEEIDDELRHLLAVLGR
jgi:RNA polymerase sigma-70 factor (ECF subfamily)